MSSTSDHRQQPASADWARREQLLQEFDRAWQRGERPDIDAYRKGAAADSTLLAELVHIDLERRIKRGEPARIEDYLARFPELAACLPTRPQTAGTAEVGAAAPAGDAGLDLRTYELLDRVGRGGMGEVFRGTDPALGRDLAVKVLRPELRGLPGAEGRFAQEARLTGALQHPNIVPVHNLGRLPDGRLYFTMKLVRGRTLADLLTGENDAALRLELLDVFEKVCQAVAYAHSKGVIHRDLKPANVMVGAFGEVQVMDWGLAKVLERAGRGGSQPAESGADGDTLRRVSRTGLTADDCKTGIVGTPAYMAPEQARGEADRLDERADVFGLGAILCEILTGRPPYGGATIDEVLRQAADGDLAEARARLDRCGADAELAALCRACLEAEPVARPRDAGAVAQRLSAYLTGVQERLRRAELERAAAEARAVEERKRRRVALALAAAVLALVGLGAGGGLFVQHQAAAHQAEQDRRDAQQRQAVESALEKAAVLREQAHWGEARAVLEQAQQALGDAGPDDLRQRLDGARAALELVSRLDGIRQRRATLVEGHFDDRGAEEDYATAFREAGLGQVGDDAEAVAQRVRDSGVSGPLVAALAHWAFLAQDKESRSWLLAVARRADPHPWADRFRDPDVWGDRAQLRRLAGEALRDGGAQLDQLSPQLLEVFGLLLGESAEAVPLLLAAQSRYPNDFWLNLQLGNALYNAKREEEALGYFRAAVALRPDVGAAHNNLSLALYARKDFDGAVAELRRALDLNPREGNLHNNLGRALRAKGDVEGAIAEYQKAIDLDPKPAPGHYYNLGTALYDKPDVKGAIAAYQKAVEIDPDFALGHIGLGNALRERGDLDRAIAESRRAIELAPGLADAHANLGIALYDKGDLDGAIAESKKAIELDPKHAQAHTNLGIVLHAKGDVDGAIAEHQKAIEIDPKLALAHAALGQALMVRGRFAEARAVTKRCMELFPPRAPQQRLASQQLEMCDRLAALDQKLPALLAGEAEPANAAERLTVGVFCQQCKRLYAAAARFYAGAFAADPRLAADLRQPHRYNAACAAALAAAGQGEDARHLPDKAQLRLRRQALAWLHDDLALYARLAERPEPAAKQLVRQRLAHWREDADLASVRDPQALDRLPDDEREQWRGLWDEVNRLLRRATEAASR